MVVRLCGRNVKAESRKPGHVLHSPRSPLSAFRSPLSAFGSPLSALRFRLSAFRFPLLCSRVAGPLCTKTGTCSGTDPYRSRGSPNPAVDSADSPSGGMPQGGSVFHNRKGVAGVGAESSERSPQHVPAFSARRLGEDSTTATDSSFSFSTTEQPCGMPAVDCAFLRVVSIVGGLSVHRDNTTGKVPRCPTHSYCPSCGECSKPTTKTVWPKS